MLRYFCINFLLESKPHSLELILKVPSDVQVGGLNLDASLQKNSPVIGSQSILLSTWWQGIAQFNPTCPLQR